MRGRRPNREQRVRKKTGRGGVDQKGGQRPIGDRRASKTNGLSPRACSSCGAYSPIHVPGGDPDGRAAGSRGGGLARDCVGSEKGGGVKRVGVSLKRKEMEQALQERGRAKQEAKTGRASASPTFEQFGIEFLSPRSACSPMLRAGRRHGVERAKAILEKREEVLRAEARGGGNREKTR